MSKGNFKRKSRRCLSLAMLTAFSITLASCNSYSAEYGSLDVNAVYASAGDYQITNGELWDELKWDAVDELDAQIENVIINEYSNKIRLVMKNDYSSLTDDEKNKFDSKEEYTELYDQYKERLIDYVVQDIYNFSYSNESYWENLESVDDTNRKTLVLQYLDDLYLKVKTYKIDDDEISDLINNASEDDPSNFLKIATAFPSVYYPEYAKELYALAKLNEDADEADEDDDDEDDDDIGNYTRSNYVSKFRSLYANQFDLDLIMIRFASETEYTSTLRAFGIKIYNKNLYYIPAESEDTTYDEYVDYYDDFTVTANSSNVYNLSNNPACVLQLYVEMYNYVYGGYYNRDKLDTGYDSGVTISSLNDLRNITSIIVGQTGTNSLSNCTDDEFQTMIDNLIDNDTNDYLLYTRDELDEISTTLSSYLYETLVLEQTDEDTTSLQYSTSSQEYNDSYYIAFKVGEGEYKSEDGNIDYKELYNSSLTTDEIFDNFKENETIYNSVRDALILDDLTETAISSYISDAKEDVKIKIYNEAIEIGYLVENEDYSKTLSGNSNPNVLATIEYDGTTYNFNLKADSNDSSTLYVSGTTEPYGAFDALESSNGPTTALDLLSQKVIKNTKAYEETNEDREDYEDYIEAVLYNFSNNSYSSSGYSSSIGKYNFMMLYFHDVDVDNIIDNYYRVQVASSKLLTDYSSDALVNFFLKYSRLNYENYFSLEGQRLVVYYDGDDDIEPDDVDDWKNQEVEFDFGNGTAEKTTLGSVAKFLVLEINNEISATTGSHADAIETIVSEINECGKINYDSNPVLAENSWAKYRYLGLNVMTEDISVTNSTTSVDFTLKQRLYDYAKGEGTVKINGSDTTVTYQYYINDSTPTEYIQPYDLIKSNGDDIASLDILSVENNNEIVETSDGYNLILVTSGTTTSSAKWTKEDNDEGLLENIVYNYNDNDVTIDNVYNDTDELNYNQILLYLLEYSSNSTSNLLPSSISDAISNYLSPVYSRYTDDATQRIVLLYFIQLYTKSSSITFTDEENQAELTEIVAINERSADDYNSVYDELDTTGTYSSYKDWWTELESVIEECIIKDGE